VNGVADTWLIRGPFAGVALLGRVAATFLRGAPTVLDGKLAS
jgi:hypothetical protein